MSDTKTTTKKFSEFGMVMNGPIDVVGLKDGQNVRATLTTDLVETNPGEAFRDAKGRFRSTADYSDLTNQLKVNRFIANELDLINGAIASLQAGSVVVQDDPPNIEEDGQLWLDSNRLELFISYDGAWISTTPLAARVEQGEAVQAAIIEALDDGIREQTRIRSRVGDLEANSATKGDLDTKLNLTGGTLTGELKLKRTDDATWWNYIRSEKPNAWDGGDSSKQQVHGLIIDVGTTNTYKQQFKITGRNSKDLLILSDDGKAHAEIFGLLKAEEMLKDGKAVATEEYVDNKAGVATERPMLWKYNPNVMAEQLGNGEFNLSENPTNGAAGEWSIYFAKRDANGQYWYPHDNGNEYTHEVDVQLATIRGREQVCAHGKTLKWYFNQGTNKYARLKLSYYRSGSAMASGKWYLLTIPGYMPYFTFSTDAQSNGTHS